MPHALREDSGGRAALRGLTKDAACRLSRNVALTLKVPSLMPLPCSVAFAARPVSYPKGLLRTVVPEGGRGCCEPGSLLLTADVFLKIAEELQESSSCRNPDGSGIRKGPYRKGYQV